MVECLNYRPNVRTQGTVEAIDIVILVPFVFASIYAIIPHALIILF